MTVCKPAKLFQRLREGHMLITANSRLARVLADRYDGWRAGAGDRQWPRAPILSWSAWLDRLWQEAALGGVAGTERAVPGDQQALSLWSEVLERSELAARLLRPRALARQARDSRRLAVEWELDFGHPAWRSGAGGNENHAAFAQWNRAFEALCRERGWLPAEDRVAVLPQRLEGAEGPADALVVERAPRRRGRR